MLHFAGRIAFGMDVGNFLKFERAFKGDVEMDAATEIEEVARVYEMRSKLLALLGACLENFFNFGGDSGELFQ